MTKLRPVMALVLALALADIDAAAASSGAAVSRPLNISEILEWRAEESRIVTLARILRRLEPSASEPGPKFGGDELASGFPLVLVEIEPMQFLRGGLDGDVIRADLGLERANLASGRGAFDAAQALLRIAGVDTMAAILFLSPIDGTWWGATTDSELILGQTHWKAIRDRMGGILNRASLDSTLARADLVAIAHRDFGVARERVEGIVHLQVETILAGTAPTEPIPVRTIYGGFPAGAQLVCVNRGKDGVYEPIPFARTVLSTNEVPGRPPVLSDARLKEVKEILARVRPAASGKR